MANPDEIALLKRCASPRERQNLLGELFEQHRDRLHAMVSLRIDRRIQGRLAPSDVLQEAYIEAAAGIDKFIATPSIPLYLWLRYLAGTKLRELHRRHLGTRKRAAGREVSLEQPTIPVASSEQLALRLATESASPSDAVVRAELREKLEDALEHLEPLDREVIALRHYEQLKTREVAQALGIKEETARKRYLRAIERLKKVLARPGGLSEHPT